MGFRGEVVLFLLFLFFRIEWRRIRGIERGLELGFSFLIVGLGFRGYEFKFVVRFFFC